MKGMNKPRNERRMNELLKYMIVNEEKQEKLNTLFPCIDRRKSAGSLDSIVSRDEIYFSKLCWERPWWPTKSPNNGRTKKANELQSETDNTKSIG